MKKKSVAISLVREYERDDHFFAIIRVAVIVAKQRFFFYEDYAMQ
jgi:hypothetical protein